MGRSGEEGRAVGLGVTADKGKGSELALLGGVGPVSTAGVRQVLGQVRTAG